MMVKATDPDLSDWVLDCNSIFSRVRQACFTAARAASDGSYSPVKLRIILENQVADICIESAKYSDRFTLGR